MTFVFVYLLKSSQLVCQGHNLSMAGKRGEGKGEGGGGGGGGRHCGIAL